MFAHTNHKKPFTEAAIFMSMAASMCCKFKPPIWSRDNGHIFRIDVLPYFLTMVLRAPSSAIKEKLSRSNYKNFITVISQFGVVTINQKFRIFWNYPPDLFFINDLFLLAHSNTEDGQTAGGSHTRAQGSSQKAGNEWMTNRPYCYSPNSVYLIISDSQCIGSGGSLWQCLCLGVFSKCSFYILLALVQSLVYYVTLKIKPKTFWLAYQISVMSLYILCDRVRCCTAEDC